VRYDILLRSNAAVGGGGSPHGHRALIELALSHPNRGSTSWIVASRTGAYLYYKNTLNKPAAGGRDRRTLIEVWNLYTIPVQAATGGVTFSNFLCYDLIKT
jgi:hypothetical protein